MLGPSWTPDAPYEAGTSTILFSIGKYQFHAYSLTMMLGMLAAVLTITIFWAREKYKFEILLIAVIIVIPSSIIGARMWHLVEEKIYNPNFDFKRWYAIWEGGLSIQGGVIMAFIMGMIYGYTVRDKLDIRKVLSFIVPSVLIGQVIGRWGNFANHEVYGLIDYDGSSSLIFGHSFASNMYIHDSVGTGYRYPLFLYEGLANLVGYLVLVWIINWFGLLKPGSTSALYFVWYGCVRLALEPLRQETHRMYSIASGVFIAVGAIFFLFFEYLNPVHYIRVWRNGHFKYAYAHEQKYIDWLNSSKWGKKQITEVVQ